MIRLTKILLPIILFVVSGIQVSAAQDYILLQSTTSTQNSGLYDYLLPIFTAETGIEVRVVAVGTGQAIRNAVNGDADVLLVHAKSAELEFVSSGNGTQRFDLMYNEFVIVGPRADPIQLESLPDLSEALRILSEGEAIFVSRGDDSGTHKKERELWGTVGVNPAPSDWYRETGAGMGATLRMAIEMQAYTLTDRATWIAYGAKQDARIVFEGGDTLFNQYGIIALNPAKYPHVNVEGATKFVNWMLGPRGQALIGAYTRNGQQLFFPNAK
ncbi:MAG: substrate-binding domain-containing protein [Rhodobacteraceae bacterium]|nr:substrate-binding domain-containing protein [Paracoccaceae bacterium]